MAGRPLKLPPDERHRLRQWASYGRNVKQVAAKLGVTPETLRRYLRGEHRKAA